MLFWHQHFVAWSVSLSGLHVEGTIGLLLLPKMMAGFTVIEVMSYSLSVKREMKWIRKGRRRLKNGRSCGAIENIVHGNLIICNSSHSTALKARY